MSYTFSALQDPVAGSAAFGPEGTAAGGVNSAGQVTGWYFDSSGETHGFLYNPIGSAFTTLDFPPNPSAPQYTTPAGINDSGEVVGTYEDDIDGVHGFLYNPNNPVGSQWTTLDYGDVPLTGGGLRRHLRRGDQQFGRDRRLFTSTAAALTTPSSITPTAPRTGSRLTTPTRRKISAKVPTPRGSTIRARSSAITSTAAALTTPSSITPTAPRTGPISMLLR